jgi:hypothetical protein
MPVQQLTNADLAARLKVSAEAAQSLSDWPRLLLV